ncbi:MAG: putative lipid II flippase FtsW [bacterium]|nr:putative lipid II flippase FtsW [bacterium]
MLSKIQGQSDRILLFTVFALLIFGLIMITSAGVVYSQSRFGDQYYFFKHQLLYGILPGLLVCYLFQRIDYHCWKKVSFPLFLMSLVFLILVFVPGIGSKLYGASRWIGFGSISFQPSEMAKLAIVIYLAAWLESRGARRVKDFFEGFLPFIGIMGIVGFLIIKQPDMGTLGVIIITMLIMFFASGSKLIHLFWMAIAGIASFFVLVKMEPYRFNRLLIFLNPNLDPRGIGYHINQALLAIGSGGILGLGLGHSRQKFYYLPEPVGDSIFAILSEELGLIGGLALIIIFLVFAFRSFKISKFAPDDFGKLLGIGITSWIIAQAFINIASISALIPLTGVPLPFISYGGTSVVFLLAGVGILLNISKQSKLNN